MTTILPKDNLRVLTFDTHIGDSDGRPVPGTRKTHNLLYNSTRISDEEVERLINNDAWEFDSRVVDLPTCIINNLKDKKEED